MTWLLWWLIIGEVMMLRTLFRYGDDLSKAMVGYKPYLAYLACALMVPLWPIPVVGAIISVAKREP